MKMNWFSPKGRELLLRDKKLKAKKKKKNSSRVARLIKPGPEGNGNLCSNLQVLVVDFQNIGDVEGPLLGAAGLLHELSVDIPSGRHDDNDVLALLVEEEGHISYLRARQEEIESGTQGIDRQVVNLRNGGKRKEMREIGCDSIPERSW